MLCFGRKGVMNLTEQNCDSDEDRILLFGVRLQEKNLILALLNLPQCDILFSVMNKKYQFVMLCVASYCLQSGMRFGRLVTSV